MNIRGPAYALLSACTLFVFATGWTHPTRNEVIVKAVVQAVAQNLGRAISMDWIRITVSRRYAYAVWDSGPMAGSRLLENTMGGWRVIGAGGGAMNRAIIEAFGVDRDDAYNLADGCVRQRNGSARPRESPHGRLVIRVTVRGRTFAVEAKAVRVTHC